MGFYTEFSQLEIQRTQPRTNRIGILGGTFNPVHNGHLRIAYIALYEFLLGEIVFLPLGTPPHKSGEAIAPACMRLDMIRIAIEGESRFSVSSMEIDRVGCTYTVDTLEALRRNNHNAEYYFIIGADTLFELRTWKRIDRVMLLTSFICVLRPGQDDIQVRQYADALNDQYGGRIYIAREEGPDISSSHIRLLLAHRKSCEGLVPAKVARYLDKNRVYACED